MSSIRENRTNKEKSRKSNLILTICLVTGTCLYIGFQLGATNLLLKEPGIINAILEVQNHILKYPFSIFPTDWGMVAILLLVALCIDAYFLEQYIIFQGAVDYAHGDAKFEDDFKQFDKEFLLNPAITNAKTYYDEDHKKIGKGRLRKDAVEECRRQAQIYAERVYLSMDGKWTQRNLNAIVFGATGVGKSRNYLLPNVLNAFGGYVISDPSGDLLIKCGSFLESEGYLIKCFNIDDMTKSSRFNPLYYIRKTSDIPIIVNTLIENTQTTNQNIGDADFWRKATQSLLCAIFGYLFEVEPVERRNFSNALELLRMAKVDEAAIGAEVNDFDRLFQALGDANPTSYAFKQYEIFKMSPAKTALNVLISTGVLISQFVDIPEFNNLTYKDELELDKLGEEKIALFLCIPQGDTTFNWIASMLFAILFNLLYHKGVERQQIEGLTDPELRVPVRCLIDEAANIGKIPNLSEKLASCRKYRLYISLLFQNYSQIVKVYGKEDANSIIGNCDTMVFLGGADSDTLKIVCDKLGKETVKVLSYGNSKGRGNSNTINKSDYGKELLSRIQVEQMKNTECLVFIRSLRPFKVKKYRLEKHPNYKYTGEANKKNRYENPFQLIYNDEDMEAVRIKKISEEGYTRPQILDSARRRAQEEEKKRMETQMMAAQGVVVSSNETKTKEQFEKEQHIPVPEPEGPDVLKELMIKHLSLIDSYAPAYEFDQAKDFRIDELLQNDESCAELDTLEMESISEKTVKTEENISFDDLW